MLAYSSIAQAGFMMFAVFAANDTAKEGLLLYAAAYSLATIGIFAVLAKMDDMSYEGFNGLSKSEPLIAALLAIFLLSLAGIPLTAGFFAKYYMLASVIKNGGSYLALVIIGVLFAAISAYYYFRVIQAMYFKDGDVVAFAPVTSTFKYLLLGVAVIIVILGVFPNVLFSFLYF
jgi:NADH-quinone oxidoreductase subunit N